MPLFGAGLAFLNLMPFVVNIIKQRICRRIASEDLDNLMNDMNMFLMLGCMWQNLLVSFMKWLKMRRQRKQTNPHTLIRLLLGYRYVHATFELEQ